MEFKQIFFKKQNHINKLFFFYLMLNAVMDVVCYLLKTDSV